MTDSRVAQDPNRLPWLAEERSPRRKGEWTLLLLGALLSALVVAGVSFWLGARNASEAERRARPAAPAPVRPAPPQPMVEQPRAEQVRPAPVPIVQPVPEPTVRIAPPEPVGKASPSATRPAPDKPKAAPAAAVVETAAPKASPAKPAIAKPAPLKVWPATVSEGANGRVVRIGAYGSRTNAKKGWWQIIRRYPGMRRLNAVVAPVPAPRTGKTYYRLQFGTTSQAHSEVLCQRMRAIRKTCAVVGLPSRSAATTQPRSGARG